VAELLAQIIENVRRLKMNLKNPAVFRSLVFYFKYSNHKGVIV